MPELPEVETIRRDLEKAVIGKKIKRVEILDKKIGGVKNFARFLVDNKIFKTERIGKLLIFELADKIFLLIHLKMTGQLIYQAGKKIIAGGHGEKSEEKFPNKHTRLIIYFSGGEKLFFNDLRRFGYVRIADLEKIKKISGEYGIEPLQPNFTWENFQKALVGKRNVKAGLLDQKKIAGIGNIYADEILFSARILPSRNIASLSLAEKKRIFLVSEKIIALAIKYRGTTFSDYTDTRGEKGNFSRLLKVYGRDGTQCPVCGKIIKKAKIAGRGTHFCSNCQK